ncbi:MAG: DUF4168 domain-containing protein [Cyanobacteria bacterium P01_E01_bin.6]
MINTLPLALLRIRRSVIRAIMLSTLTCLGVVASAPHLSGNAPHLSVMGQPAHAQVSKQVASFDATEIRNYALSVLDLESLRQQRSSEIANELNVETLPAIACHNPESIRDMNRDIRAMVVQFCSDSISVVEGHNLSVGRFNEITQARNSNPSLQEQITEELLNLQRDSQASAQ